MSEEETTAYHEAGHAVAAFFLNLDIGRHGVTIISTEDALGSAHILRRFKEQLDVSVSPRNHLKIENYAIMSLAGNVAQQKFRPGSEYAGHQDLLDAADLLDYISGSTSETQARINLAQIKAEQLVDLHWKKITAVAEALLRHKTMNSAQVLRCFQSLDTTRVQKSKSKTRRKPRGVFIDH